MNWNEIALWFVIIINIVSFILCICIAIESRKRSNQALDMIKKYVDNMDGLRSIQKDNWK